MSRAYSFSEGQRFHLLTVVELLGRKCRVRCDCGTVKDVLRYNLISGATKSCGCLARAVSGAIGKRNQTHGQTDTPEYVTWQAMRARCYRPSDRCYAIYGGRGIEVCSRWRESFEAFYADMGQRPTPDHSLDRFPNKDGNYEPGNCRWATPEEQGRNKSNNRLLTWRGETLPLIAWAERQGMRADSLRARLLDGWPLDRALTAPVAYRSPRRAQTMEVA